MKYILMMCVLLVPAVANDDDGKEGGSTPPAKPTQPPSGPGVDYMPYGSCTLF